MKFRSLMTLLVLFTCTLLLGAGKTDLFAQAEVQSRITDSRQIGSGTAPGPAADSESRKVGSKSILDVEIPLKIVNAKLVDAIRAIVKSVDATVTYGNDFSAISKKVSIDARKLTLKEAITKALEGTGYEAYLMPPNEIVVRRTPSRKVNSDSMSVRITVKNKATDSVVPGASIEIPALARAQLTGDAGHTVFRQIPAGTYKILVRRIGYATASQEIIVDPEKTNSIVVYLNLMASTLTEVVTTGAASRAKLEVGTSIATLDVEEIMRTAPVTTVSELLAQHIPGVIGTYSQGTVGAPTRIRIRGNTSIESDNEPMYIVDGIRVSNDVTTEQVNQFYSGVVGGRGQNAFSQRIDDLDPNMIESIEVLKGPTASTLYGSEAANGVIIIKTKRGKVGPTRWNARVSHRELIQSKDYPFAQRQLGTTLLGNAQAYQVCDLQGYHYGTCTPIEGAVLGFNMLRHKDFTPIGRGYNQSYGGSVSGGVERLQFSFNFTRTNQLGNPKMPKVNEEYIREARGGAPLSKEILRPNARNSDNVNFGFNGILNQVTNFMLTTAISQSYMRSGNNGMEAVINEVREENSRLPLDSWRDWNATRSQEIKKVTISGGLTSNPQIRGVKLTTSANFGWDFNLNDDIYHVPPGSCEPTCQSVTDPGIAGFVNGGRKTNQVRSGRLITGVTLNPTSFARIDLRGGVDLSKSSMWNLYGAAEELTPGYLFYRAGKFNRIQDLADVRATAGWFYEPSINLRNKLFLNVGMRGDYGSALGAEVSPRYPKWNGSWILSEETFFPAGLKNYVDVVRIRMAYGQAGIMPTSLARVRTYNNRTGFVRDDDLPGSATGSYIALNNPGNLWVRPERTKEYEGGFEIEVLDQRFGLDVTAFRKYTKDAIQGVPVAASIGSELQYHIKRNLGHIVNSGFELSGRAEILRRDNVNYRVRAHVSRAANKLYKMDEGMIRFTDMGTSGDLYSGNVSRIVEGYPLFGRWAPEFLGFYDEDGDGKINWNEVRVGDTLVYIGSPQPKLQGGFANSIGLLGGTLSLNANFSFVYGQNQYNSLVATYRSNLIGPQGAGSLEEQACMAASYTTGRPSTHWCFFETVNTLRFDALSLTTQLPRHLVSRLKAASASVSINASNLWLWTGYSGKDPHVNSTPVNLNNMEAGTVFARPKELGVSLSITF